MYKLLTEEEKEKVMRIYVERRTVVILKAIIAVLIIAMGGILPSYMISRVREGEMQDRKALMDKLGQNGDEEGLQFWLSKVNRKLQVMSPKFDTDRPSEFIRDIVDEHIAGVSLTGFSWLKNKGKTTLSINGIATDRQTLLRFEDKIKDSGHFSGVSFPVSDLAQNKNIDFQIKFAPLAGKDTPAPTPVESAPTSPEDLLEP